MSGFLGSALASFFGFPAVFIAAAVLSGLAAAVLMTVPEIILPPKTINKVPGKIEKSSKEIL